MMGGALGLAVLASLAAGRTDSLLASGDDELAALDGGYQPPSSSAPFRRGRSLGERPVFLRTTASAPAHESEQAVGNPAAAEAC